MDAPRSSLLALTIIAAFAGCTRESPEAPSAPTSSAAAVTSPAPASAPPASSPAVPQEAANGSDDMAAYQKSASALQAKLVPGADLAAVRSEAAALMEQGARLVPGYIARFPECKAYLEAALKVRDLWQRLDAETMERDYHHDGALPKHGDTPVCYHVKDLVVHPATALVLLAQSPPDVLQAQAEIAEVVQHAGFVETRTASDESAATTKAQ